MRHRSHGQTIVFAAIAMVALVGGLAMVVDTGMFFVIQRHLHSAADAGALAGAWHHPVCVAPPGCLGPNNSASTVATEVALANASSINALCGGTVSVPPPQTGTTLVRPSNVVTIVVTVECDAGYSFGRILGLGTKHISASAAAAIGDRNATLPTCNNGGDMTDFTGSPPCGRMARLIE